MLFYSLIVSLILVLCWFYVWERLIETAMIAEPLRQLLLGFFVIAFLLQATRWFLYRSKSDLTWITGPAYFTFGLLTYLVMAAMAKDLLYVLWSAAAPGSFSVHEAWVNSWVSYVIFFGCLVAALWGAQTAYEGPEVTNTKIDLRKDESTPAKVLRIAHISDLHVGPLIKKHYVETVVRMVNELEADVICVTGDLGDGYPEQLEEDLEPLKHLKSKYGAYYCTGNHEYYWSIDGWIHAVKRIGMQVLFNDGILLPVPDKKVWLAGVPDITAWRIRKDHVHDPEKAAAGAPAGSAKILLAHEPQSCDSAERAGFDLLLCGHTHGGQYFPFTWVADWINPYARSLNKHHRMWVYVNVGTGFWGPPIRLGAVSEVALLEVTI